MKMHVAGEDSVRQALNIYKRVRRGNHNGPRHEIVYFSAIHKGQFIPITSWGGKIKLAKPGIGKRFVSEHPNLANY
jgi:predicted amidohydrolase YtcJ